MKDNPDTLISIKIAVALSKILDEQRAKGSSHARIANNPDHIINSYAKIALEAGLRKATVSDLFNANKYPRASTLVNVLSALGKTMTDFGKYYDRVTDSDIQKFKERSNLKKPAAAAKKKISKNN